MSTIDLDEAPAKTGRLGWVPAFAGAFVGVLVAVAALAVVVALRPPPRPTIVLQAQWLPAALPTAHAWYVDGTREDITARIAEPWQPPQRLRLVTLVAAVACQVWVDDRLAAADRAADDRYAVCAWVA